MAVKRPELPFYSARMATDSDIDRMAYIAATGFKHSPVFDWERPQHSEFSDDTILSYKQEMQHFLHDGQCLVVVATGAIDSDENSSTWLPENPTTPEADDAVGVAVWKLPRAVQFPPELKNNSGTRFELPPNRNRDRDDKHWADLDAQMGDKENRYFSDCMTMEILVVHPAYWRQGHGTRLVKYGQRLSAFFQVDQGVIAARMGVPLYKKLGYAHLEEIRLPGDNVVPDGVQVDVMKYSPKAGSWDWLAWCRRLLPWSARNTA